MIRLKARARPQIAPITAALVAVALVLGHGATQALAWSFPVQYAEEDNGELDGGEERAPRYRADPDSKAPSEDGTDGPPIDRDAPADPPGCGFNQQRPLELLV